jgi:photosystem II stability/assembly factor-like uncharacterized protein
MKKSFKILAIVLIALFLITQLISGCGLSSNAELDWPDPDPDPVVPPGPDPDPDPPGPDPDPGPAPDPVIIGLPGLSVEKMDIEFNDIWVPPATRAINGAVAVGERGMMVHYNAAESMWEVMNSNTSHTRDFKSVWGTSPSNIWAVGTNKTIAHFDGNQWTLVSEGDPDSPDYNSVWGTGVSDVYIVGEAQAVETSTILENAGTEDEESFPLQIYKPVILRYDGTGWNEYDKDYIPLLVPNEPEKFFNPDGSAYYKVGHKISLHSVWTESLPEQRAQVYAVGNEGAFIIGGGTNTSPWSQIDSFTEKDLLKVWAQSGVEGSQRPIVVGKDQTLFEFDPTGPAWVAGQFKGAVPTGDFTGLWGSANSSSYAITSTGEIWQKDTQDEEWALLTTKPVGLNSIYGVLDEEFGSPDEYKVFVVGKQGKFYLNTTGAFDLAGDLYLTSNFLYDVWGTSVENVYAVGEGGIICRRTGAGWTNLGIADGNTLYGIWGSSANNIYAVGANGVVRKFNGTDWGAAVKPGKTNQHLYCVWGSGANNVIVAGDSGTIFRTTDNGATWTKITSGTSEHIRGLWGTTGKIFAVGRGGLILLSTDGGVTWAQMSSGVKQDLWDVWGVNGNNVFAVGDNVTVLNYDGNVEQTWTSMDVETQQGIVHPLRGIWGSGANDIHIQGWSGTRYYYDGEKWTHLTEQWPAFTYWGFYKIWGLPTGDHVFSVGDRGLVFYYERPE